jgi:hypothetical protein
MTKRYNSGLGKGCPSIFIIVGIALVVSIGPIGTVSAENVIFEDDFESYAIGNYLSTPWYNIFSGQYGFVTAENAYSGTKSFKSQGRVGWSRNDAIPLYPIKKIGYEISIYPMGTDTRVVLYNRNVGSWGSHDAVVCFNQNGQVSAGPTIILASYNPNEWYRVRVEADFETQMMDVYLNGELVGTNIPAVTEYPYPPGEARYNCLSLQSLWYSSPGVYYDDVKVFDLTAIPATVDIDPDTLNLKSNGKWITAYIELPEGYDVADIDVSTILLEDTISAEANPTEIGDYDEDGFADLMVKFDRSNVQEILEVGDEVEITVTGELTYGTLFEGTDTIRVIDE